MLIDGKLTNIRFERTDPFNVWETLLPRPIPCPDVSLGREYPAYHRWADFFWKVLTQEALPQGLKVRGSIWPTPFLEDTTYDPATLTILSEDEHGVGDFLVTRRTSSGSSTYSAFFTMDIYGYESLYGFILDNIHISLNVDGKQKREFHSLRATLAEVGKYDDISEIIFAMAEIAVVDKFRGTLEAGEAMQLLTFNTAETNEMKTTSKITWSGDHVTLVYGTVDGRSIQGKITGDLREVFGQEREDLD
ncbi:hypothetical protein [Levilactobacillus brevis]|uniref:hypothetical protein n=1 Tax=Levilactobacillus brevis TaxID=1580 RepID=UPI0022E7CC43|nr:hypothetical protein [Levilactobacillus brevis]